jgi:hypothetical protein
MDSAFRTAIPELSLAAIAQLSENSRLGFATRNPALYRGIEWSKSTLALGLPEWAGKTASGPVVAANNGWSFLGQNSTWWKTFLKEAVQPWKDQCANVFANAFANGGIVNAVSENLEGGPDPDEVIKQAGSMAAAQYVVNNGLVCPGCSSTYRAIVSGTETAATSFVLADAYTRIGQGAYAEISSYLAGQCR